MRVPPVATRSVLITGCSSGIGEATAHFLKARGWQVFPTVRKEADAAVLRAAGFTPVQLDLADSASLQQAAQTVLEASGGRLGALVNNAGYCQAGALEDLSREALRRQFEANVFGLHELTARLLPVFRQQGYGRIVNISSVFGRIAAPMLGAYCASKYAVEALSDALRVEWRDSGIAVSIIEPGAIVSKFRKNAAEALHDAIHEAPSGFGGLYAREVERRRRQNKKADFFNRPPEEVAEKVHHALTAANPRRRYYVTPSAHLVNLAARFLPAALCDRLLARQMPPHPPA